MLTTEQNPVSDEDEELLDELWAELPNVPGIEFEYCPTGPGGGINPHCSPEGHMTPDTSGNMGGGAGETPTVQTMNDRDRHWLTKPRIIEMLAERGYTLKKVIHDSSRHVKGYEVQRNADGVKVEVSLRDMKAYLSTTQYQSWAAFENPTALPESPPPRPRTQSGRTTTERAVSGLERRLNERINKIEFVEYDQGGVHPPEKFNTWMKENHGAYSSIAKYKFQTPSGRPFTVKMNAYDESVTLSFMDERGSTSQTGSGESAAVFKNVVPAVVAYVRKYNPKSVGYTASGESRVAIYQYLTRSILKLMPDRQGRSTGRGSYASFRVTRRDGTIPARAQRETAAQRRSRLEARRSRLEARRQYNSRVLDRPDWMVRAGLSFAFEDEFSIPNDEVDAVIFEDEDGVIDEFEVDAELNPAWFTEEFWTDQEMTDLPPGITLEYCAGGPGSGVDPTCSPTDKGERSKEREIFTVLGIDGETEIEVYANPTLGQAKGWVNKYKEIRGLLEKKSGALYIWDAWKAEHDGMARELGLLVNDEEEHPDWDSAIKVEWGEQSGGIEKMEADWAELKEKWGMSYEILPPGITLAWCPTGEGGGVDPTCPPANKGKSDFPIPIAILGDLPVSDEKFIKFLDENGAKEWKAKKLPKGIPDGEPQMCFVNATQLAVTNPGLSYVEGYAFASGVPEGLGFLHAWCVNEEGEVIDNTWENPEKARYYGVKYDAKKYMKHITDTEMYGVFGGDDKEARKVLERGHL